MVGREGGNEDEGADRPGRSGLFRLSTALCIAVPPRRHLPAPGGRRFSIRWDGERDGDREGRTPLIPKGERRPRSWHRSVRKRADRRRGEPGSRTRPSGTAAGLERLAAPRCRPPVAGEHPACGGSVRTRRPSSLHRGAWCDTRRPHLVGQTVYATLVPEPDGRHYWGAGVSTTRLPAGVKYIRGTLQVRFRSCSGSSPTSCRKARGRPKRSRSVASGSRPRSR
jgi:hypothetical protein